MLSTHVPKSLLETKRYRCDICNVFKSNYLGEISKHRKGHLRNSTDNATVPIHQIKVNDEKTEWQCQKCSGIFFDKVTLSKHLDLCNLNKSTEIFMPNRGSINATVGSKQEKLDLTISENNEDDKFFVTNEDGNEVFSCSKCGLKFSSFNTRHIKDCWHYQGPLTRGPWHNSIDSNHKVPMPGKSVDKDIEGVDKGVDKVFDKGVHKKYYIRAQCPHCESNYAVLYSLVAHLKSAHNLDKYGANTARNLFTLFTNQTDITDKEYGCNKCKVKFESLEKVKLHYFNACGKKALFGKHVDKDIDIDVDKDTDKDVDKSVEKGVERGVDKSVDKGVNKGVDKSVDKNNTAIVVEKDVDKDTDSKRLKAKVLLNQEKKQASFMQVDGNFIKKELSEPLDEVQPEDVNKDINKVVHKDVDFVAENNVKIQFNHKGYVQIDKDVDKNI